MNVEKIKDYMVFEKIKEKKPTLYHFGHVIDFVLKCLTSSCIWKVHWGGEGLISS